MASSTSFKQQCPSCEAMVPIRDPALVGRKIDCPKCKYRFVVEKPEEEDDSSDTPAPKKQAKKTNGAPPSKAGAAKGKKPALRRRDEEDEEDERPKKKQSGASNTVILGGVLGLLALGLLAFGAIFVFGGFGGSAKPGTGSNSLPSGGSSAPQAVVQPTAGVSGQQEAPAVHINVADISNLLPNDSEAVFNYQIDKLSSSSLRDAALVTSGAFNDAAFKSTFGFPIYDSANKDGVQRVVTALNNSKHWVFSVMRTMKPINRDKLIENLGLEALPEVNKLTLYSIKHDLDSLSNLLLKANRPHDDFQVCIFDGQTLVFGDPVPMAKFAADGGRPKQLSDASASAPGSLAANPLAGSSMPSGGSSMAPSGSSMATSGSSMAPSGSSMRPGGSSTPPAGSSMPPSGSSTPPSGSSMAPGGSSMAPSGSSMAPGGTSATSGSAPAPAAGSYLTINPGMKAVFEAIERPDSPTLVSMVLPVKDPLLPEFGRYLVNRKVAYLAAKGERTAEPPPQPGEAPRSAPVADRFIRLVGFALTTVNQERIGFTAAAQFINSDIAKRAAQGAELALNNPVGAPPPMGSAPPMGSTPPNGFNQPNGSNPPPPPPSLLPRGFLPPEFMPEHLLPATFLPSAPMQGPPGVGGPFSPGSAPPGGSFASSGSSMRSNSFTPPPGGSGAGGQGTAGEGGFGAGQTGPNPTITVGAERDVVFVTELRRFEGEDEFLALNREMGQFMIYLKGDADLIASGSRIHDLAASLQKYVKEKGHFPRGTADRPQAADLFANWAPDQRVSWMADLLPYLGEGEYGGLQVDPRKSWQEGDNLNIAGILIPQYLARSSAAASPRVRYPGVAPEVAMTNYVGIAGVGLDAAEYAPGNPNAGVFGYNRETKPADVKRGLDQTIALLQVPAEELTPWLAGGGATVRGVSDGPDAVKPFVCTEHQGKRGTFAVMADGKVRFIPETIDPKIFRTLCLIVGDKVQDLDKIAPVVAGEVQPQLKAAGPPVAAK